ncbi:MAG: radical SAM protein [Candidatus Omnitrophica bacterium]|nr:radical SAM protein [Candidatus Omnitrophota bacterium]
MNILFIYSLQDIESFNKPLRSPEYIQFGISYISAVLKKYGHQTKLLIMSRLAGNRYNTNILDKHIDDFQPNLICFTAVFSEYHFIADIARYVKKRFKNIFLLVGGAHTTLNPESVLMDDFDALCMGEGEYPTLELVEQLENSIVPGGIANLWIKHGSRVEKNPTRSFLDNLDSLPVLDREMWQEWIEEQPGAGHAVLLGRGCPFECTYCSNHSLKKVSAGKYVRLRSVDKIVEEIREVNLKSPNHRDFYLEIETFYVDKKWALELCSKLLDFNKTLPMPLSFGVNLRITPNVDYKELFMACKESNFSFINIGLESGSERIRRDILKRNYSNLDVIKAVRSARECGLKVAFFNLVGIPGETESDFEETVKMNRVCLPDWNMTSIFFPYPGTQLNSYCKENGLIGDFLDTTRERDRAVLDLPNFSKRNIQKRYEWLYFFIKPSGGVIFIKK